MYQRILVPTDGGDHALAAARRAFDLAAQYGASVHGLYVIDTNTGWLTVSKSDVRTSLREVGEDAGGQALAAIEEVGAEFGADPVTEIREGTPDEEILAYVEDEDIDLVVMGIHGRDGLRRRLLGSVAERVVRGATVPVMTVTATSDSTS